LNARLWRLWALDDLTVKKLLPVFALFMAAYIGWVQFDSATGSAGFAGQGDKALALAFDQRKSDVQAEGNGIVIQVLPDDNDGAAISDSSCGLIPARPCLFPTTLTLHPDFLPSEKAMPLRSTANTSGTQAEALCIGHIVIQVAAM
jgi:hypothetical protein